MIKSLECEGLYWAIPVGNWNHRNKTAQDRIKKFMEYPENDMRMYAFLLKVVHFFFTK